MRQMANNAASDPLYKNRMDDLAKLWFLVAAEAAGRPIKQ
jgi:hypothetical protein